MGSRRLWTMMIAVCVSPPVAAWACLWDYDTVKMERSRFPQVLELITGKFLRHTPEFYEWRIQDRTEKRKADPKNLAWLDDLAAAHEKLGHHDEAIAIILKKDEIQPGLYETEANLGTFLIHAGKLEEGLDHIRKAIAINPNAHFGREKTQQQLVEYVLSRRQNGKTVLPLAEQNDDHPMTFARFLGQTKNKDWPADDDREEAIKGVLGMMRFGHYDSPILLEVLGDLTRNIRGSHLAARAYLKASWEVSDPIVKEAYRQFAIEALNGKAHPDTESQITIDELEADLRREVDDASAWYAKLANDERAWITSGKNPEQEFDRLYDAAPEVIDTGEWYYLGRAKALLPILAVFTAFALFVIWILRRMRAA